VGVDEANIKEGKIAFVAPIAKLLIDKKVGDKAILKLATKIRIFEIQSIAY
jgi:transcription elongation factor GreB